jgi:hypothetical protein
MENILYCFVSNFLRIKTTTEIFFETKKREFFEL